MYDQELKQKYPVSEVEELKPVEAVWNRLCNGWLVSTWYDDDDNATTGVLRRLVKFMSSPIYPWEYMNRRYRDQSNLNLIQYKSRG